MTFTEFEEVCIMPEVRRLAYLKWLSAGSPNGSSEIFWFAAEVEVWENGKNCLINKNKISKDSNIQAAKDYIAHHLG